MIRKSNAFAVAMTACVFSAASQAALAQFNPQGGPNVSPALWGGTCNFSQAQNLGNAYPMTNLCKPPILAHPHVYLTFWSNPGAGNPWHSQNADPVDYATRTYIPDYVNNLTSTRYFNTLSQYTGIDIATRQYTAIGHDNNILHGPIWEDNGLAISPANDPYELVREVNHFGYDPAGVYLAVIPFTETAWGGGQWVAPNQKYNYFSGHNEFWINNEPTLGVFVMSDILDARFQRKSMISQAEYDNAHYNLAATLGVEHELVETMTDPYPSAGYSGSKGEIADMCEGSGGTFTEDGYVWIHQFIWDNKRHGCAR